jgi:hypothetical protein
MTDDWNAPGSDTEDPMARDIGVLLDRAYELLDGFQAWLEESLNVDIRTAQQDCFNAESLLDYLANQHRKRADEVNEFELRWFAHSHYIRKAMADPETEERLLDSLYRFFHYLQHHTGAIVPGWVFSVLDDRAYYALRRSNYAELNSDDERQDGFRIWNGELVEDLDTRCLWLPGEIGEGMEWGASMGWREATLQDEANRLWQDERAELLADGLDFESVRERLAGSYLFWADTPQDKLDDATPRQVIRGERYDSEANNEVPDEE